MTEPEDVERPAVRSGDTQGSGDQGPGAQRPTAQARLRSDYSGDRADLLHELELQQAELERQDRELRRAMAELEHATGRYRAVYDNAPIGHLTVGVDGRIDEANRMAASLLGVPVTALFGGRLDHFVGASDRARLRELLRRTRDPGGGPARAVLQLVRGARATHVLADCIAIPPADRDCRVLVTLVDRTEQELARETMAEREARLRAVIAHAGDVLLVLDVSGRVRGFDEAAERMFGFRAADVLGRPVTELFEELPPSVARGEAVRWDGRICRADGSVLDVEVAVGPVPETNEIALFVRDVTDRRKLERDLRYAQKVEAMGRLSAGIAHDMNNVLMAVVGAADRAARRTDDPQHLRERLGEIRSVAEGGAAVVRRLTRFARGGRGAGAVELDAVVRDVVVMLRPLMGEDIDLAVVLDAAGVYARCDAGRLEQVVVNLAVNARDAMPAGGRLEVITCRTDEDFIRLTVCDSGMGMEPAVVRSAFEPFFTTKEDGSGLGLSVVKSIVEECGGRVEVRSDPGRTEFILEFPVALDAAPRYEEAGRVDELPPQTVLLVEDDALVRRAARSFLERGGHRVVEAANATQALRRARRNRIDVVLTDVVLQADVSGPELAQRIRRECPWTQVLLMSGYSHYELVKRGRIAEDSFVLQKPFSERELHSALASVVAPKFSGEYPACEVAWDAPTGTSRATVTVVEPRAHVRDAVSAILNEQGYDVRVAADLTEAHALVHARYACVDALVMATHLSDGSDLEFAERLLTSRPGLGVVLLVSHDEDVSQRLRNRPNVRCLLKPAATAEIVEAIEAVCQSGEPKCA